MGSVFELNKQGHFILIGISLRIWTEVLSQFPSLHSGKSALSSDSFKAGWKIFNGKIGTVVPGVLLRETCIVND